MHLLYNAYLAAITTPIVEATAAQMRKKTCLGTTLSLYHFILLHFVVLFASVTSNPSNPFAYSSAVHNLLDMFLNHQI